MTYLSMFIIVLFLIFISTYGMKYEGRRKIFNIQDTTIIKGIFCIIIILVHIPSLYQNKIQDMIGSFAYIGVTFFFMASAYGLKYGLNNKKDYLKNFWRKRLLKLLIPQFMINIILVIIKFLSNNSFNSSMLYLLNVNAWVELLIVFYLIFYLVNIVFKKTKIKDILIILFVVAYSLITRLSPMKLTIGWGVESLGFAYGIILYNVLNIYEEWINKKYFSKIIFLFFISLIVGLIYIKNKQLFFIGDYLIKVALGILLLMLILQVTGRFKIGNKISMFLGKISYEIYLSHNVIFMILDLLIDKFKFELGGGYIILSLILTIILSVIIDYLTNLLLNIIDKVANKWEV